MKESVLDVLIYLFENYMIEDAELQPDQDLLQTELSHAGFSHREISRAFEWLENLAEMCDRHPAQADQLPLGALRCYTPDEETRLDIEARGLLLSLEHAGVLDGRARELVIDRIMALDDEEIDLDDVKWVVMMVLCNQPDRDQDYTWAEDLVLDGIQAHLH